MVIREKLAREILVQNWDGSRENAEYAWDNDTGEIEKAVYYKEADIYLAILCAEIKKMELSDEELWSELNKLWESQETGQTAITYPEDPNIIQARAISQDAVDKIVNSFLV